ncbi:hypothetical protein [Halopiger xanaduensis]|uniref:Uncharacterized protein n=1 Tax=Halopiger xanaduensis (strain DSM 18323 / JCM 14033 / SH-6) TaxID=797210 RepID=F8D8L8_HALXS|nr:hypothetical protein [Halopiger xanaduensis]AEH36770.1 hypothetical protein Halxa_2145 [Halopiger xanaduensis SH-6]
MTDERTISRRDSLRGIATTGTLIGGAGLGIGTVSAGEDGGNDGNGGNGDDGDDLALYERTAFEGCHSVFVLFEDADELPTNLWIQTYNAERGRTENVVRPVMASNVYAYPSRFGDYYVAEFNAFQFYDRTADSGDKVLSVTYDGETVVNQNCGEQSDDGENGEDGKDDGKDHKKGEKAKKEKKKEKGHYDETEKTHEKGKKHDKGDGTDDGDDDDDDNGTIDLEALSLEAVCVDSETGMARFRVENENDASVSVGYEVHGADRSGSVGVQPNSATYFDVGGTTSEGMATLDLLYEDIRLDTQAANTDEQCIPRNDLNLFLDSVDAENDEATFYVMNYDEPARSVVVRFPGTDVEEIITVPANGSQYFTVSAPDGDITAAIFYEGVEIDFEPSDD